MKNDRKETYSLTAKERKAQRHGEPVKKEEKIAEPSATLNDTPAGVVAVGIKPPSERLERNKPIIILGAVVLAVVMIVTALLIMLVFAPMYSYRDINNPVAVISLSNGDKIELEIYEYETPNGATNFLYLASKGFFDDTIIFDTTNKYVRFGQYQSNEYADRNRMTEGERKEYEAKIYRSRNEQFLKRIQDIHPPSDNNADSVFDYRMKPDTASTAKNYNGFASKQGYISNIYTLSGTEFQICSETNQSTDIGRKDGASTSNQPMDGYVIGYCANMQSLEVVKKIGNLARNKDNGHPYWSDPVETIRIKKVKLYKMDMRGKWRDFNWDNWAKSNDAVSWWGGPGIKG